MFLMAIKMGFEIIRANKFLIVYNHNYFLNKRYIDILTLILKSIFTKVFNMFSV